MNKSGGAMRIFKPAFGKKAPKAPKQPIPSAEAKRIAKLFELARF